MRISLEEQLDLLSTCGVRLVPEVNTANLLASSDRQAFEKEPFVHLLCVMGGELDVEPFIYASDDIWHFDTECIEDHNDYVKIAQRLVDLAGDALPLQNIADHVDIEAGEAWLSFELDGKSYNWTAIVEDDWVDPLIMRRFAELLVNRQRSNRFIVRLLSQDDRRKRFTYYDLGGQDCLIGCSSARQLARLRAVTNLDFKWLA